MNERCVLVVEDSPTMRQLIGLGLRRVAGLTLVEADNGLEALELLDQYAFDLILLDLNMPVMSGFVLLEKLRERADVPPIIVITTESGEEDINRALSLGVAAYIMKPVRAPDLADTVREILGD
jgi:CheY-like chemotaxis protein